MLAGSRGSVTSSQRKSRQTTTDVHAQAGMAPAPLDPPKRNEVVMTREEAQKKKPPKGYAFVPVLPVPSASTVEAGADAVEGRRTRHGQPKHLDDSSSARCDAKTVSVERRGRQAGAMDYAGTINFTSASTEEARGQKRKSMSLNLEIPKEDLSGDCAGQVGVAAGYNGNSGHAMEEKKRKKEEKRRQREKLLEELRRIEEVNAKIEERAQELRSKGGAAGSESAGDSNKRLRRSENGGADVRWDAGGSADVPAGRYGADDGGFGETAQSEPRAGRPEMTRQASLQFSDATPGVPGKEKRTPKANSAYINQDFVSGHDKLPPPEKQKSKGVGLKRGLASKVGDSRTAKRQRFETARAKRLADIMKMCGTVLKKLLSHKWAWVFDKPVDAVALNLPDYHTVIKHPMDLGTVDRKLKAGDYAHAMDFAGDVRLTFSNAMTYNRQTSDVYIMADELKKTFESQYRKVAEKVREEELRIAEEDEELAVESKEKEKEVQELQRRLKRLESQVELKEKKPSGPGRATGRTSALPKPRKEDTEKRPMTFEEKRKLSVNLGKLPGDKLGKIVQIISSNQPNLTHEDDEIELDIDSLDNDTLWELERYVANVMKSKSKQKRRSGEEEHTFIARTGEAGGESSPRKRGEGEDEVDIDDDQPARPVTQVEVEKDDRDGGAKSSSSESSSSDDSGSSSSDSESGSASSGSDAENEDAQSKEAASRASREKEPAGSGAAHERKSSAAAKTDGGKKHVRQIEEEVASKTKEAPETKLEAPEADRADACDRGHGASKSDNINAKAAELITVSTVDAKAGGGELTISATAAPISEEAAMRAALLRGRYADSILNAQKKATLQPSKSEKIDPKKLEEMERKQREERSRLAKEALAAQEARRKQEEQAQAELRKKREEEREAARRAIHEMERTVNLDENSEILKDLRRLNVAHDYQPPVSRVRSPPRSPHGMPQLEAGGGGNLLERLGLFMKEDYDEGEEVEGDEGDGGLEDEEYENGELSDHGVSKEGNGNFVRSEHGHENSVSADTQSRNEEDGKRNRTLTKTTSVTVIQPGSGDGEVEGEIGEAGGAGDEPEGQKSLEKSCSEESQSRDTVDGKQLDSPFEGGKGSNGIESA